jgi:hypothetical protein
VLRTLSRLPPAAAGLVCVGVAPGDLLTDSGYAHGDAAARALPLRAAGAHLIQCRHPFRCAISRP